jgi:glutamate/tyrosine decarboxylase-like PLP-dependent enzyme
MEKLVDSGRKEPLPADAHVDDKDLKDLKAKYEEEKKKRKEPLPADAHVDDELYKDLKDDKVYKGLEAKYQEWKEHCTEPRPMAAEAYIEHLKKRIRMAEDRTRAAEDEIRMVDHRAESGSGSGS